MCPFMPDFMSNYVKNILQCFSIQGDAKFNEMLDLMVSCKLVTYNMKGL